MSLGPFDFVGGARTAQLAVELAASSAALTVTGDNLDGWPDGSDGLFPFTLNRGEDNEERILGESRSGNVITVYDDDENGRGWDDTSISLHQVGATLEHTIAGRVEKENSAHVYQTDGAHGADGDVVGQNTLDTAVTDLEALIDSQIALLAITKAFIAAKG